MVTRIYISSGMAHNSRLSIFLLLVQSTAPSTGYSVIPDNVFEYVDGDNSLFVGNSLSLDCKDMEDVIERTVKRNLRVVKRCLEYW